MKAGARSAVNSRRVSRYGLAKGGMGRVVFVGAHDDRNGVTSDVSGPSSEKRGWEKGSWRKRRLAGARDVGILPVDSDKSKAGGRKKRRSDASKGIVDAQGLDRDS